MRVKGVCAFACCGALSLVQMSPCGARGGAGRSRAAVWKGTERMLVCCLMERFLSVSTLLMCRWVDEPQVWQISP